MNRYFKESGGMLLRICISLCFVLATWVTNGQTADVALDTRISGAISVCSDSALFMVSITNTAGATLSNVKLYPQMPLGVLYVSGTATGMTEVLPISIQDPAFSLPNLTAGQQLSVTFKGRADCSYFTVATDPAGTTVNNITKLTYSLAGVSKSYLEPNGSDSYSVLFPELELFVPPSQKNISVPFLSRLVRREITVRNTGLGKLESINFYLKTDAELVLDTLYLLTNAGKVLLQSTGVDPILGRKYTLTNFQRIGDQDRYLESNEELKLLDVVHATTSKGAIETIYTGQWGCSGAICNTGQQQAAFSTYIQAIGGEPNVAITKDEVIAKTDFCNDPLTMRWTYFNSGNGNSASPLEAAFDVSIGLRKSSFETTDSYQVFLVGANGAKVNVDHLGKKISTVGLPYYYTNYEVSLADVFTSDPDGSGGLADVDGDGYYDDLPVGNQFVFEASVMSTFNKPLVFTNFYYIYPMMSFKRWSGSLISPATWVRDASVSPKTAEIVGSTDVVNAKRERYSFSYTATINPYLIKEGADAGYRLDFTLPQGVRMLEARWGTKTLNVVQSGNQVVIQDQLGGLTSSIGIDFDLRLDCQTSGSALDSVKLSLSYYYDKLCSPILLAKLRKDVYLHCGDCNAIETTLLRAERSTFGWKLPTLAYSYGELYGSASNAVKVDRNTLGIKLDAAYPLDYVELSLQGRTSVGTNALNAEIRYTAPQEYAFLDYQSAEFLYNGKSYTLATGPSKTKSGSTFVWQFVLPVSFIIPSGAVFELRVKCRVADMSTLERGVYPLKDFRGRFYQNGQQQACLDFGDDFTLFKPGDAFGFAWGTSIMSDNMVTLSHYNGQNASGIYNVPDFPGEFRPLFYPEEQTITLPKGLVFDTSKPVQFMVESYYNRQTLIDGYSFSSDKRSITIRRNADAPIVNGIQNLGFLASFLIDCQNPENQFVPNPQSDVLTTPLALRGKVKGLAYLPSAEHSSVDNVNHDWVISDFRRPALALTSNSTQEGYGQSVTWPVQLCNVVQNFRTDSPNTWVAVELKGVDQSTVIQSITDDTNKPLDFFSYGPRDASHPKGRFMMVRLGELKRSLCQTIKVNATYINCKEDSVQDINIYAGWDYRGYPGLGQGSVLDSKASCEGYAVNDILTIKYRTTRVQTDVVSSSAAFDLCTPIPFSVDVTNTRYGYLLNGELWLELPDSVTLDVTHKPVYTYGTQAAIEIPAEAYMQSGSRIGWDLKKVIGRDLPGISPSNDGLNKLKVDFKLVTECGFDAGLPVKMWLKGMKNCGEPLNLYIAQRKIRISGANPDSVNLAIQAPEALSCFAEHDVTFHIQNFAQDGSSPAVFEVILPVGTEFREVRSPDWTAPAVSMWKNQVRLRWSMPALAFTPGEDKILTLRTYLSQTPADSSTVTFFARMFENAAAFCGDAAQACTGEVTSAFATLRVPVSVVKDLDIQHAKYLCAYQFRPQLKQAAGCTVTGYTWDFGDGSTSRERSPMHAFSSTGVYTVKLRVEFNCGGCSGSQSKSIQLTVTPSETFWKDTVVRVPSFTKDEVLQVSVATFSDAWPTQYLDSALQNKPGFVNGTEGVWRGEGTYVYNQERKASVNPNVAIDGTFTLQHFNWGMEEYNAIPGWIKGNSMTQYSPFSYELENKDVLGVYSSALYDYNGQLPTATGVNMRNAEMAFTSFESSDSDLTAISGNWTIGRGSLPTSSIYIVNRGQGPVALVEAPVEAFRDVTTVEVNAKAVVPVGITYLRWIFQVPVMTWQVKYVKRNIDIVCIQPYPQYPQWSQIVLANEPFDGLWHGTITVRREVAQTYTPVLDATHAHSGESSLKISEEQTYRQHLVKPQNGGRYIVNAWVYVLGGEHVTEPKLADSLGIDVVVRDRQEREILRAYCRPAGPIIEGWQQVRGSFMYNAQGDATIELLFKPGSKGTAWYDDLRFHPESGNMKSYVYDVRDFKLRAVLDEENFASFYYYDTEGNLFLVKKETEKGVKTISENVSNLAVQPANK